MAYSKHNEDFSNKKNNFFMQLPKNKDMKFNVEEVARQAGYVDYTFLLNNQKAFETEFSQMFAVLQNRKDENNEAFWLYCYYCATLLETFYKAYTHKNKCSDFLKKYSKPSKEDEYRELKEKIRKRLLKEKEDAKAEEEFIESLKNSFITGLGHLLTTPFHLSQIRDYIAYANLCRVYWVFCRLTLVSGLTLAKDTQIIEKLDALLGMHTDTDKIIDVIKAPNGVLNYFSVGLFLARFAIDAGYLVQHTFFPTEEEKKDGTTAYERFKFELYKRHCNFANDLVWATINFLTNFSHITHISDPTAGALTAIFLGFDVCMTLYKCQLAKREYLIKKAQYEKEMEDYLRHAEKFPHLTAEQRLAHVDMLQSQLKELEIDWRKKEATFYFNASAAALLMLGFTASLLLSGPGVPLTCFFVCTVAVAMYLSSDAYAKYQEKGLRLEQAPLTGKEHEIARMEYEAARNDFYFTMLKNTVMPTLLIATYAVCWPAAIALTVLYIGYEIYHASEQHESKKQVARLALEGPVEKNTLKKDAFKDNSEIPLLLKEDMDDMDEDLVCCF